MVNRTGLLARDGKRANGLLTIHATPNPINTLPVGARKMRRRGLRVREINRKIPAEGSWARKSVVSGQVARRRQATRAPIMTSEM
jgi:hypothetical protein